MLFGRTCRYANSTQETMQMDLTPFFANVDRIATALETIARNTKQATFADLPAILKQIELREPPRFKVNLDPDVLFIPPLPDAVAPLGPLQSVKVDAPTQDLSIEARVKQLYEAGHTTANAIAVQLHIQQIPAVTGKWWNNVKVKKVMDQIGLVSTHQYRGGRGNPKPDADTFAQALPEPEPELPTDPEPVVTPKKPVLPGVNHFNEKRQKIRAFADLRAAGSTISDAELISQAIAEGRVTKLPAYMDSDGFNHLEGKSFDTPKGGYIGSAVRKAVR
ncbi:hypothetical protein [Methylobacterium sp. WL120]|uniref:hypothetical protein n=1 Tax=Methylobacterium sp. WL120 TaxID=2603887 RepID=UPI0011CC5236|nr:hypothetical protein [Methylobacterium sp. WL120]TXM68319.1 hypothetical protein FV229_08085 [Methylobacterium sp. WL120]